MSDEANLLLTDSCRPALASDEQYDGQLKDFVHELRKNFSIKAGKRIDDPELLRVLHPATNTLGYIFLLLSINVDRMSDLYIISLAAFLTQFDPVQARYAGLEWRRLLDMTEELVHATQNSDLLTPFRTAILRMDPTFSTLTKNHLHYVRICLQALRPREALPILNKDWLNFPYDEVRGVDQRLLCEDGAGCNYIATETEVTADLTVVAVQEYYLLGAQIYIGLRNYDRASLFLELVLSTPGVGYAVNGFMVEAYKKLVLVSLVSLGHSPQVAHIVEAPVSRTLNYTSKPYEALADAFKNRDLAKFHAEVDVAGAIWADDGNLGLVQECAEALRRYRVLDMQKTYAAVPVESVAMHLSLSTQSTTQLLQSMIQQSQLQATIASANNSSHEQHGTANPEGTLVIRFHAWDTSKPKLATTLHPDGEAHIKAQVRRIEVLSEAVKETDRRFSLTKEYQDWQRRNKKGADAGAAAYEDPMEMDAGYDMRSGNAGDDEDIMAT